MPTPTPLVKLSALAWAAAACACAAHSPAPPRDAPHPHVSTVEAFRDLRERGDLEAAAAWLVDDPRIWYGEREGEGSAWTLEAGRWSDWDDYFHGSAERATDWEVEGARVSADMLESNDYYRLIESPPRYWRATYFIAEDGRIEGFLVGAAPGHDRGEDRGEEFRAWARATHPSEAEYLMPGDSIDPTGDRPVRMRALLELWRAEVGLPVLE